MSEKSKIKGFSYSHSVEGESDDNRPLILEIRLTDSGLTIMYEDQFVELCAMKDREALRLVSCLPALVSDSVRSLLGDQ